MWIVNEGLLGRLICEVSVDVADVRLAPKLWHIRRRNLPGDQLLPVDSLKEGMRHDLLGCDPLIRISSQQASQEVTCLFRESW